VKVAADRDGGSNRSGGGGGGGGYGGSGRGSGGVSTVWTGAARLALDEDNARR